MTIYNKLNVPRINADVYYVTDDDGTFIGNVVMRHGARDVYEVYIPTDHKIYCTNKDLTNALISLEEASELPEHAFLTGSGHAQVIIDEDEKIVGVIARARTYEEWMVFKRSDWAVHANDEQDAVRWLFHTAPYDD